MGERPRKGASASGALDQRDEATDEHQEHENTGVVAVGDLRHEMLADDDREQSPERRIGEQQHTGAHPDEEAEDHVAAPQREGECHRDGQERERADQSWGETATAAPREGHQMPRPSPRLTNSR